MSKRLYSMRACADAIERLTDAAGRTGRSKFTLSQLELLTEHSRQIVMMLRDPRAEALASALRTLEKSPL